VRGYYSVATRTERERLIIKWEWDVAD